MQEGGLQIQEESQEAKVKELQDILLENIDDKDFDVDTVVNMSDKLKADHPGEDLYDYRLYHLMIGSTPPDSCVKFDLPDGAIEAAIRELK